MRFLKVDFIAEGYYFRCECENSCKEYTEICNPWYGTQEVLLSETIEWHEEWKSKWTTKDEAIVRLGTQINDLIAKNSKRDDNPDNFIHAPLHNMAGDAGNAFGIEFFELRQSLIDIVGGGYDREIAREMEKCKNICRK
jgi:hypothetical protein